MKPIKLILSFCLLVHTHLSVAQTCNAKIIADAPNSRYDMRANGTVVDRKTGLTWMRCALGQTWKNAACTGGVSAYTWQGALQAADSTIFAGLNDWRLPNLKELYSLVENRCYSPAINLTAFPDATDDWFWSSSPYADFSYNAWIISFYFGYDNDDSKNSSFAVRLVRGGR